MAYGEPAHTPLQHTLSPMFGASRLGNIASLPPPPQERRGEEGGEEEGGDMAQRIEWLHRRLSAQAQAAVGTGEGTLWDTERDTVSY